jgi:hypothetical protein
LASTDYKYKVDITDIDGLDASKHPTLREKIHAVVKDHYKKHGKGDHKDKEYAHTYGHAGIDGPLPWSPKSPHPILLKQGHLNSFHHHENFGHHDHHGYGGYGHHGHDTSYHGGHHGHRDHHEEEHEDSPPYHGEYRDYSHLHHAAVGQGHRDVSKFIYFGF